MTRKDTKTPICKDPKTPENTQQPDEIEQCPPQKPHEKQQQVDDYYKSIGWKK